MNLLALTSSPIKKVYAGRNNSDHKGSNVALVSVMLKLGSIEVVNSCI